MKFATRCVRVGNRPDPTTGAIVPPIYQTATYTLEEVGRDKGFDYTRSANPTRAMLEENLASIEGGKHGVCYASGMSAVDSLFRLLNDNRLNHRAQVVPGVLAKESAQMLSSFFRTQRSLGKK